MTQDRVSDWLRKNPKIIYYETSALDGSNVNEAVVRMAQNYLEISNKIEQPAVASETPQGKKKFDLQQ